MDLGLAGRAALVAGGSRGIGLAVARAFAAEGADVALVARGEDGLRVAARELSSAFPERRFVTAAADLRDEQATDDAVERCAANLGRLDAAVANAGNGRGERGWDVGVGTWGALLQENLITAANACRAAAARLSDGGALCLVGSIAGSSHLPSPLPYGAAKAAVERYGKDLAHELAPRGIRVNVVAPGNVLFDGGRWEELLAADRSGVETYVAEQVPLNRFATPDEVADAIVFLCSERSAFTTAATLVVDGGQRGD